MTQTQLHHRPRLVIGGTGSGVGKTTVTLGLLAAFKRRGLHVQGFKCGPDYIDPSYHTAVTGRPSRNLDTWMTTPSIMREVFLRGSQDADLSIIEGVMGYYDGKDPRTNQGSTAEISMLLQAPTILLVNIASMARSAAAIVKGFCTLTEGAPIAGIIANQAGSTGHISLVRTAIEQECGIPLLGGFTRTPGIEIPERHLGLIPAVERGELEPLFQKLADLVEEHLDLDRILTIAQSAPPLAEPEAPHLFTTPAASTVKIAVARDAAFNFYYAENLELLEQLGAQLHFFSPLAGEKVPADADALYLGGGFPEEFARELHHHAEVRADLYTRISDGLPTLAECGGYMYLCNSITDRAGESYEMVGLIPSDVQMQDRLAALGYREAAAATQHFLLEAGEQVRGHEFHYSTSTESAPKAYVTKGMRGQKEEGYTTANLVAGYTHLYFPSNPGVPRRFVEAATTYQTRRA
ncbi:cobyrinate a,c-diamide synthase [Tumebacillus sp. ITR2]|uniref:Cobyrinate a,c-diamide synthase n=1 Tax=Tumebacillus amylolyticus TaxID=2801339 RepID=A0ABS1J6B8_9BACL|nr:cobyrinate a,c-diamide synthase [Tumebacillus amylolyticus]MBL0385816.1 cobyrinate a,c-diamide synthase [Tumebacillus amylolyticus]